MAQRCAAHVASDIPGLLYLLQLGFRQKGLLESVGPEVEELAVGLSLLPAHAPDDLSNGFHPPSEADPPMLLRNHLVHDQLVQDVGQSLVSAQTAEALEPSCLAQF